MHGEHPATLVEVVEQDRPGVRGQLEVPGVALALEVAALVTPAEGVEGDQIDLGRFGQGARDVLGDLRLDPRFEENLGEGL